MVRIAYVAFGAALLIVVSAAAPRAAESAPDDADKIAERWAAEVFGTSQKPKVNRAWPIRYGLAEKGGRAEGWQLAAGRVVYEAKCAGCHGANGSGAGPQAKELVPAPRDFRRGTFKFQEDAKAYAHPTPSRHDLAETLRLGLPGTAMPAFDNLSRSQRDAVIEYVRWLSMRGEYAYRFTDRLRREFDIPNDATVDEQREYHDLAANAVKKAWKPREVEKMDVPVSEAPPMTEESIARGKEHYESRTFGCFMCHSLDGRGIKGSGERFAQPDDWGQLQEVTDLTQGIFKGGDGPRDLYMRLRGGIPGSPHPATGNNVFNDGHDRDFWELVHYVYHLAGTKPAEATMQRRPAPKSGESEEQNITEDAPAVNDDIKMLAATGWGKLSGRVIYGGDEAPTQKELKVGGDDAPLLKGKKVLDPSLVVQRENLGIANTVIWIEPRQADGLLPIHESLRKPPDDPLLLVSREFQFHPHVLVVRAEQPLTFRNENPVGENFRLTTARNPAMNQAVASMGELSYAFRSDERLPAVVTTSIHPWAKSYLVCVSHPYVAVSDENGDFTLQNVPAGTWQIRLWHERIGTISTGVVTRGSFRERDAKHFVTVAADEANTGEIVLDAKLFGP